MLNFVDCLGEKDKLLSSEFFISIFYYYHYFLFFFVKCNNGADHFPYLSFEVWSTATPDYTWLVCSHGSIKLVNIYIIDAFLVALKWTNDIN